MHKEKKIFFNKNINKQIVQSANVVENSDAERHKSPLSSQKTNVLCPRRTPYYIMGK